MDELLSLDSFTSIAHTVFELGPAAVCVLFALLAVFERRQQIERLPEGTAAEDIPDAPKPFYVYISISAAALVFAILYFFLVFFFPPVELVRGEISKIDSKIEVDPASDEVYVRNEFVRSNLVKRVRFVSVTANPYIQLDISNRLFRGGTDEAEFGFGEISEDRSDNYTSSFRICIDEEIRDSDSLTLSYDEGNDLFRMADGTEILPFDRTPEADQPSTSDSCGAKPGDEVASALFDLVIPYSYAIDNTIASSFGQLLGDMDSASSSVRRSASDYVAEDLDVFAEAIDRELTRREVSQTQLYGIIRAVNKSPQLVHLSNGAFEALMDATLSGDAAIRREARNALRKNPSVKIGALVARFHNNLMAHRDDSPEAFQRFSRFALVATDYFYNLGISDVTKLHSLRGDNYASHVARRLLNQAETAFDTGWAIAAQLSDPLKMFAAKNLYGKALLLFDEAVIERSSDRFDPDQAILAVDAFRQFVDSLQGHRERYPARWTHHLKQADACLAYFGEHRTLTTRCVDDFISG